MKYVKHDGTYGKGTWGPRLRSAQDTWGRVKATWGTRARKIIPR